MIVFEEYLLVFLFAHFDRDCYAFNWKIEKGSVLS